jgi:CheY-like chemotaxis protein
MAEDERRCVACGETHQAAAWYAWKRVGTGLEYLCGAEYCQYPNKVGWLQVFPNGRSTRGIGGGATGMAQRRPLAQPPRRRGLVRDNSTHRGAGVPPSGRRGTVSASAKRRKRRDDLAGSAPQVTGLTKRPRVLVVEDTAIVLDVLRDSLARLGYHVVTASNADEAVSRFRERAADLLITDLAMPGVSGWGLITALMARVPGLPVVVVTGTDLPDTDRRVPEFGVTLLRKPFTLPELAAPVALAMATRK